ncbi:MAG: YHS domain-containing protein [Bacteroidota bacterium]
MKTSLKITLFIALVAMITSCAALKENSTSDNKTDPVCGMKVAKSNAYHYKYEGTTYYFDKYECKQTFKMNPTKFIGK